MRKIINDPQHFVDEVLDGILAAHGHLLRPASTDRRALVRADAPATGRVGIVTGGGSGHLPFFLGYVGPGLCSGVAVGNVFSSPSVEQVHATARAVDGGAGVLFLYGNYGGDVYTFDLAADLLADDGIATATVLGTDDLQSAPPEKAGTRRGVAGLVLVYKAAGAAAESGVRLDEVRRIAQKAVDRTRTMGVGLSPTILPAAGEPTFTLADGEMEIGIGIHGERGAHRGALESADEITDRFLAAFDQELSLSEGTEVAVLVNGLGATPLEELYVIYRRVQSVLADRGVRVRHRLVGEYVTSLEMAGASVSVMVLDDELATLLTEPASSPFMPSWPTDEPGEAPLVRPAAGGGPAAAVDIRRSGTPSVLRRRLLEALPRMSAYEDELRELDAALGDGDLGLTVTAGTQAVVAALEDIPEDADAASVLRTTALAFASANPSTFSALCATGLLSVAGLMGDVDDLGPDDLVGVAGAFADRVAERGGALPGDKTLLDVVLAIRDAAAGAGDEPARLWAPRVAADAVARTTAQRSRRGRAAWQGERTVGLRDPGSVAILRLSEELAR